MAEPVIAVVFDFDETLGPDTISYCLEQHGVSVASFWKTVDALVLSGWDPPLAYMHQLLLLNRQGRVDLSLKTLRKFGKKLTLFPGLPTALLELKEFIVSHPMLKQSRVILEMYILSGGLEGMIRGTKLDPIIDGIFGCNFAYDDTAEQPTGIQSAISFTEKTRFLHGIRKGVDIQSLRAKPYRINDAITSDMQRIPFSQMVYIGDGPSDIPCLSPVVRDGGIGIGVSAPFGTFKKGYELARGKRITVGPYTANYKKGSDMRKVLEEALLRIALAIDMKRKEHVISAPAHSS